MLALAVGQDVGVDIEMASRTSSFERVTESFFTQRESAVIRAAPRRVRGQLFLATWTVKEAGLKVEGLGIGSIRRVEIKQPGSGERPGKVVIDGRTRWYRTFMHDSRYIVSIAYEHLESCVRLIIC